jgi:hypothetical protein
VKWYGGTFAQIKKMTNENTNPKSFFLKPAFVAVLSDTLVLSSPAGYSAE